MWKLKEIALIGCLFILGVQSQISQWSDICAFETDGTRLPLPLDCKRFVLCLEREVAEIRTCPRGLHFNRNLGECDFQWRADCTGLSLYATIDNDDECVCTCCEEECNSSDPTETTTPCAPENETTDESTIVTELPPGETSTDSTFNTDTTVSSSQTPPMESSTQNTNPTGSTTQAPPVTGSTTQAPPVTGSTTQAPPVTGSTTQVPPDSNVPIACKDRRPNCVGKKDGDYVPVEGVCTNYIRCANQCCVEMTCPSNLYFDFVHNQCDYFWNVNCTQAGIPDANGGHAGPSGVACDDPGVCRNKKDGLKFANPDTNGFFICQCQCPIAMPCDPNLKFNEAAQVCDWNRTVTANCPSGLVYNATSNQCDYPEGYVPEVQCNNDVDICKGQEEGTLFPMEGVCNKFYKCNFNCAVEQSCPNNLIYSSKTQICDYPQNVKCEWPYTPPSGPNAGPSGISCEDKGRCQGQKEGTFLPSLTSCSGYSVCQCECEIKLQCKEGLSWDQTLKTCNYNYNVNCPA